MRFYIYNRNYNLVYTSFIKYENFEEAHTVGNNFLHLLYRSENSHTDWVNVQVM